MHSRRHFRAGPASMLFMLLFNHRRQNFQVVRPALLSSKNDIVDNHMKVLQNIKECWLADML